MVNPFDDPFYLIPPLVNLAVSFILLVIVWFKGERNFANTVFCGFLFSIAAWGLLMFGMRSSQDVYNATLWERALSVVSYAGYLFYYHFTLVYTGNKGGKKLLFVAWLLLFVIAGFSPTELVVKGMFDRGYGYAPDPGLLAIPFSIICLFLLFGGVYNLLRRYRVTRSYEEKNRLLYLSVAALFPLAGMLLDGYSYLPPMSVWGYLLFCLLCSVAILKYHLLDIRIVLRKSLAYLLISIILGLPYAGILYLLQGLLNPGKEQWWMHVLIILGLSMMLHPIYTKAQDWVDRIYYHERYRYLRSLEQLTGEVQSIVNLQQLSARMTNLMLKAFQASSITLLMASEEQQEFILVSSIGLPSSSSGISLYNTSPVVKWLDFTGVPFSSEQLDIVPRLQSLSLRDRTMIQRMNAELYVPLKTQQGWLSGILVFGPKLSQKQYSSAEKRLLLTLGSQMAMSLENARLYDEEKSLRQEVERQNRQKTEFLNQVAHEMKTPLTSLISSSELLGNKLADSKINDSIMERLIDNVKKSSENMDRRVSELLDLARVQNPEKKLELKLMDIGPELADMASDLDALFQGRNQTLVLDIPDNLPEMKVDRAKLEQVIYNLLSNASKFSPYESEIILRCRHEDPCMVIEVVDNAPLIPDSEKPRIFDPYFRGEQTEAQTEITGLGLGLFISRTLVELHKGKIRVENGSGPGNTFIVTLPLT